MTIHINREYRDIAIGDPQRVAPPLRLPDSSISVSLWAINPSESQTDLDLLMERICERIEDYVYPAIAQITDVPGITQIHRRKPHDSPHAAHGFAVRVIITPKVKLPNKGNLVNEALYLLNIAGILDDFAADRDLDPDQDFVSDIDPELAAEEFEEPLALV